MTTTNQTPTARPRLTTIAAEHPAAFADAFNTFDIDILEQVYIDRGVLVNGPGNPLTGRERREALAGLQALGVPIQVNPRHVYEQADLALLIVDWTISGQSPSGDEVNVTGTATDVACRDADGYWRYAIDNPFGVASATD
jgi:ketosteroid isomerase-like protein